MVNLVLILVNQLVVGLFQVQPHWNNLHLIHDNASAWPRGRLVGGRIKKCGCCMAKNGNSPGVGLWVEDIRIFALVRPMATFSGLKWHTVRNLCLGYDSFHFL